jgi:hypothetical protein
MEVAKIIFNQWKDGWGGTMNNGTLFGTKKNELLSPEKTWSKYKCTILSERNQPEKATYCLFPILWGTGIETVNLETDQWLPGVRKVGEMNEEGTRYF